MEKILIIDDAETLLQTLKAYLEDSGYQIFCAKNGSEGLDIFYKEEPDLVLTDIHMPELPGLEVLHTITHSHPDIPVMVISGAGELSDAIQALRLGAWDFITKPISDLEVLEHTISKALDRKRLIAENKEYAASNEHHLKILQEDQAAGRKVQMSMLPLDHFTVEDYNIKFRIIPSLELSGDFVEYFKITDELYGVYLADVSGHGASSAFITILLKSTIGQYLSRYPVTNDQTICMPEKIMQAISSELFLSKLSKYITIVYGVLNIRTGELTYGVGGHYPSPILRRKSGEARFLPGSGFPVGIRKNAKYKIEKLRLHEGDAIIMFSDGVLEVFMPGENLESKEKGLLKVVEECGDDIQSIARSLGIKKGSTTDQPDDITILTISRNQGNIK